MTPPRFSIIAAVYNVKPYLDEFIASVERQTFDLSRVEVVMVDDGSTDGSRDVIDAWAARRPELVRVVGKPNGGQASARNLGIEHATGEWVTFSDPDDMLDPHFFARADAFARANPTVELLAARPIVIDEVAGETRDHARARQYDAGTRVVDLRADPYVFPGGTNLTVMRLARIRDAGLRFDEELRPVFEDVHFSARYLLALPRPVLGLVTEMRYLYRKRATNDSTLQRSWTDPGRFTTVLERGHLDLLERSSNAPWIQSLVIYDLSWYLWEDERTGSRLRMDANTRERFLVLFESILPRLDPEMVRGYRIRQLKPRWRQVLGHAGRSATWSADAIAVNKIDRAMRLQRAILAFNGPRPVVRFFRDGREIQPAWSKTTSVLYFGEQWHSEYTAWVTTRGTVSATVDGEPIRIGTRAGARRRVRRPSPRSVARLFRARLTGAEQEATDLEWGTRLRRNPRVLLAHTPLYRRYRGAWVLMDRADDGGDNGERLFEYLREERPDINAWFTVDRDSPAWRRLRPRYGSRVVARGSTQWLMLMLNCAWLVTSHADQHLMEPPEVHEATMRRGYKIAFLQHGVTKDDISRWLNRRDFEFAAATTPGELESMVGDGTPYIYTAKEVRLTEMPRYDRLLRLGRAVPDADRRLVLIAPTWRKWLFARKPSLDPSLAFEDDVMSSEFMQQWLGVLRSDAIAAAVRANGLELAFMPHPNVAPLLPHMDLPPDLRVFTFTQDDPQEIYARLALLVTDYSSVSFDAAALDRPVVYFQFDHDKLFDGSHIGAPGYFDYARDGFGPIAGTVADVESAIIEALAGGPRPAPAYQQRIDATFPLRDGKACARVVDALEELSRRHRTPERVSTPS